MAWGHGFTPLLNDKIYPLLAVTWGPTIQTFGLVNINEQEPLIADGHYFLYNQDGSVEESIVSKPSAHSKQSAENQKFSLMDAVDSFVEKIFFISDSVLLSITRNLEIKLIYTQKLEPGPFNPASLEASKSKPASISRQNLSGSISLDNGKNRVSPIVDEGIFVSDLALGDFNCGFSHAVELFEGMLVTLGPDSLSQFLQVEWVDSLADFKSLVHGNWIQEFSRALDFYQGRVKGFQGVPEQAALRHETMKAELKLLIRAIVEEQLEKWADLPKQPPENPYADLDDTHADLAEHLQLLEAPNSEQILKQRTLVRMAIEFCVAI